MSESRLRQRFAGLWVRIGAREPGDGIFDRLLRAHREPHRHYHGVDHLRDCLTQLDAAPATGVDRDQVETALWFHDAVYRPGASDNEPRSAELAQAALVEAGVPQPVAGEVARLIRLTDHLEPAQDPAGVLVCDVDLSILGRSPAEFEEYERRIRAEYSGVAEPVYRMGRASVLSRLLAREPLYRSDHFRGLYEAAARRNLTRSLQALGAAAGTE
jgi:predicted metal-dependent HD superfamily phosphohydrolase